MDVLMRLGEFRFSVETAAYQSMSRTLEMRWKAQERLWNAPAIQFTGQGEETLQLTGKILPHFRGGLEQINTLRDMAREPMAQANPQPLPMVTGFGEYLGEYVITRVQEDQTDIYSHGAPLSQTFTLSLTRYTRDIA